jgi:hypothetical protein
MAFEFPLKHKYFAGFKHIESGELEEILNQIAAGKEVDSAVVAALLDDVGNLQSAITGLQGEVLTANGVAAISRLTPLYGNVTVAECKAAINAIIAALKPS